MLSFGNKEFRNLQEQVEKNASDILKLNYGGAVLSEFGIRVVGQIDSAESLPDPELFSEEDVGNAYAVGESAPYELYILTRPFVEGDPLQWFNIGRFPEPGPQGEAGAQGIQGIQGPRGNSCTGGIGAPVSISGYISGDIYIDTTAGGVYRFNGTSWTYTGSIKGPQGATGPQGPQGEQGIQGPQGNQGPQGDPGTSYIIMGQVANRDALPDDLSQVPNGAAYLVGTTVPYTLYVISASTPRAWINAGAFNDAYNVSVVNLTGSTSGTLNADQLTTLTSSMQSMINLNNEDIFRLNNQTSAVLVYNMLDRYNVQKPTEKFIIVTKSTGAWSLTSENLLVESSLNNYYTKTATDAAFQEKLVNTQNIKSITKGGVAIPILGSGTINIDPDLSNYATTSQLNTVSAEKQDKLYYETSSGHTQNIKTINNANPLGTGNISVQEPLVSGTNIKTINNQSLLGSGNLTVVTDISGKQDTIDANNKLSADYISGLATVATSGSYNDLTDKPTIPIVSYPVTDVQVDGTSVLDGTVAKITLPKAAIWGNITGTLANQTDLKTALDNKLSLDGGVLNTNGSISTYGGKYYLGESGIGSTYQINGNWDWNTATVLIGNKALEFKSSFKASTVDPYYSRNIKLVAPSVSYLSSNDTYTLTLPTKNGTLATLDDITGGSVAWSDITGKPTFATVATSGSYNDLSNKPTLFSGNYNDLSNKPTIPTNTNQLTNGAGFITSSALNGYATEQYVDDAISGLGNVFNIKGSVANVASLPASGNTIGDVYYVASEQAGYVWIEINNVPQWEELGPSIDLSNYALKSELPTATSDLTNDSGFITSSALNGYALSTDIPTNNNQLTNGAGYITSSALSEYALSTDIPTKTSDLTNDSGFISSVAWGDISGKPTLATVATSGSYKDLIGAPNLNNYVTLNGPQTITDKTFKGSFYFDAYNGSSINLKDSSTTTNNPYSIDIYATYKYNTNYKGYNFTLHNDANTTSASVQFMGDTSTTGVTALDLKNVSSIIVEGNLKPSLSDTYGLVLPSTYGWTGNKTIATTDQITGGFQSARVRAGTGLVSSQSTAQTSSLDTTISIASGYKLLKTSEYQGLATTSAMNTALAAKQDASTAYNTSNIVYSATQPANPTTGMIWLKPIE